MLIETECHFSEYFFHFRDILHVITWAHITVRESIYLHYTWFQWRTCRSQTSSSSMGTRIICSRGLLAISRQLPGARLGSNVESKSSSTDTASGSICWTESYVQSLLRRSWVLCRSNGYSIGLQRSEEDYVEDTSCARTTCLRHCDLKTQFLLRSRDTYQPWLLTWTTSHSWR